MRYTFVSVEEMCSRTQSYIELTYAGFIVLSHFAIDLHKLSQVLKIF